MDDLISRQEAIDEIRKCRFVVDAIEKINELPSAQPEPSTEIQEILEYLDTTLHPIVSPDNWNVYSELHDMVSRLPSAQPDIILCKDCMHNGSFDTDCPIDWAGKDYCNFAERRTDD